MLAITVTASRLVDQNDASKVEFRVGAKMADISDIIDAVDAKILTLVQGNAALSIAEIAQEIGLSPSPCWRRIKRLEEAGIITARITKLDAAKLGLDFEVFVSVKLVQPNRANMDKFEAAIHKMPEVVQCSVVTGAVDFMLRIVTRDMQSYDNFLRETLLQTGLISDVQSRIVIRQVKDSEPLPLGLLTPDA